MFRVGWIVTLREGLCKSFLQRGQQVPRYKQGMEISSKALAFKLGGAYGLQLFDKWYIIH